MDVITGAFGYIGRYIAQQLLAGGSSVRTITTHPDKPNPFGASVQAFPYDFDNPDRLVQSLKGANTLYNTYWVRFNHGSATFEKALANTRILFAAAREAGVEKIVHISVTQASEFSDLPYYRGKALQEKILSETGIAYSIVRPTLVFGKEDILVNNIAWLLRRFPVFPIFGSGSYRVQPVFVADLAEIAVDCAAHPGNEQIDAVGPETFTFEQLVRLMQSQINPKTKLVHLPPGLGILLGQVIGAALRDVVLTQDELKGLMDSLLTSSQPPNGSTHFSTWLAENAGSLGTSYSSELDRHYRWKASEEK
jgi:NADH dehydrogenase